MEERVRNAAEEGNIEALYGLIREKADFLKDIDQMEFVDTPLHIAAATGRTEFAMELMDLKPSFAKKLNQDGLSPMHLALQNEQTETALSLFTFDKDLVRVKGKNGYTPFHYAVMKGNSRVFTKFLKDCPECIHDVTNRKENAFHLAALNNDHEAFQILLGCLWSSDCSIKQKRRILSFVNRDGDTVLHIAASKNQPKIVRLLTQSKIINVKATNSGDLTALGILEDRTQESNKECVDILRSAERLQRVHSIPFILVEVISQLLCNVRKMSGDNSNALLVVTVLILTATYQASLSPPGGVFPADSNVENKDITSNALQIPRIKQEFKKRPFTAGSSVLSTSNFLWFFIPNMAAFSLSFLITCLILIAILPCLLSFAVVTSLSILLICLLVSGVMIISPNSKCFGIMFSYVYELFYLVFWVLCLISTGLVIKLLLQKFFDKKYMRANK